MKFRTIVDIPDPGFRIAPFEEVLFVGSCFAAEMGRRFQEERFRTTVNPFGVMYNPVSILHTIERIQSPDAHIPTPSTAFLTLGTNHVYRLKETGEIVDNCQKRPQSLFTEEQLSVEACADCLQRAVSLLLSMNPSMRIVLTVSPIRYRKYGYHGSQLSKATLLLAADLVCNGLYGLSRTSAALSDDPVRVCPCLSDAKRTVAYFPAYEIVCDELRDYRFYADDMLHPSSQAVAYIWQRLSETYLSDEAKAFLREWQPLKAALSHKPFHPESDEYLAFMQKTWQKIHELQAKYPDFTYKEQNKDHDEILY